jgi:Na+-translocating ferredoxin:NAD+ oxidoreductase subunit D
MSEAEGTIKNGPPGTAPFLSVSSCPHIRDRGSVPRMMLFTIAALVPAAAGAVVLYGAHAALLIALCVAAAVATEWVFLVAQKRRFVMVDGSPALTGLLLSLSLPPGLPLWMAPIGAVFAIAIVKMAFGGLGRNFLNPALAGRAFLAVAFPAAFSVVSLPDLSATGEVFLNLVIGYANGWIGGVSIGALLVGAVVLWCLRVIDFAVPLAFVSGAFVLFWCTGDAWPLFTCPALLTALMQIGIGGFLLCAFFMATDPVTSPTAMIARILFGVGCGALTFLFRKFGNADNSVMWALLLMNLSVPYLDRYCRRRPFGTWRKHEENIGRGDGDLLSVKNSEAGSRSLDSGQER